MKARVNLFGRRLFEFIPHCLGLYNRGCKEIEIHSYGGNLNQSMVLAQMLSKVQGEENYDYNASIYSSPTGNAMINSVGTTIRIPDKNRLESPSTENDLKSLHKNGFLDYPTYSLLFDDVLSRKKSIRISIKAPFDRTQKVIELIHIKQKEQTELEILLPQYSTTKSINKLNNKLISALYRSGYLLPHDWQQLGLKLANYDDVIIGVDTNLMKDAFVTNTLLPILSVVEKTPFIKTPNWILLVIPQMVIYELEKASNIKDAKGLFTEAGRRGFRALQEIVELRKNFGYNGISVVSTGESDSMMDINSFLKSMNDNLYEMVKQGNGKQFGARTPKSSSADMLIRTQFKSFVNGLNFKKGSYFMTSDKVNAAMHTSQGHEAIYVSKPYRVEDKNIRAEELIPGVARTVPIGSLLYELVVNFGSIYVQIDDQVAVKLECDLKGKSLYPWLRKQIRIPDKQDFSDLMKSYSGKLNLAKVQSFYSEISDSLEPMDWIHAEELELELL